MRIDIVTLFPEIALGPLSESIMARAQKAGLLHLQVHNLRDWCKDEHRKADDEPFGGGPGMVLKPEPLFACVKELRKEAAQVVLMSPSGKVFNHQVAAQLSEQEHLIILCGHYEGVDQRVIDSLVDTEISLGDFVLSNGALAAAVLVDAVVRLLPGALGHEQSAVDESFAKGSLDWPQYTRPANYCGQEVPAVLLSGNHAAIQLWREEQALRLTQERRPDLLENKQ